VQAGVNLNHIYRDAPGSGPLVPSRRARHAQLFLPLDPYADAMVRRTVWFSLFCLVGLALLVSVQALSPFAGKATPKTPDSFDAEDTSPLAIKSDRLLAVDDEVVPNKAAAIKTVKVAFPSSTAKEDAGLVAPQKSWRPTYASMRGRAHHVTHRHYKKRHRHRR
jgi:hypothetical protein